MKARCSEQHGKGSRRQEQSALQTLRRAKGCLSFKNHAIAESADALTHNVGGSYNTANGYAALRLNTTGSDNTAVGDFALFENSSGSQNTALGENAGESQTTGSNNVYIGAGMAGVSGESNACYIASIFNQTSPSGAQVFINANNKLGTSTSSKRFKDDIQPMNNASQTLFSLKPITFRYKKEIDPAGRSQFGLVAEDVEKVNPDLVVRDKRRARAIHGLLRQSFQVPTQIINDDLPVIWNSVCLTNSVRLVTFGKYERGVHGCARCPAGTDHRR